MSKAETLNEYISIINDISIPKEWDNRFCVKLYRGYSNFEYQDIPSIGRSVDNDYHHTLVYVEERMINNAKLKMPELFKDDTLPIQTITKLQHFGLPTRILDFTKNALVALFFACQNASINNSYKDGRVLICFERKVQNFYSPYVNAIADMSNFSANTAIPFDSYFQFLETRNYWKFRKHELELDLHELLRKPIFFESENNSERIRRQQGLFLIFPNDIRYYTNMFYLVIDLVRWVPENAIEILIPSDSKSRILRELREFGITRSFLFPEPENICRDISSDENMHWWV